MNWRDTALATLTYHARSAGVQPMDSEGGVRGAEDHSLEAPVTVIARD
jgi:hypothetical protein